MDDGSAGYETTEIALALATLGAGDWR